MIRSEKNNIPQNLIGACICAPRKIGRPTELMQQQFPHCHQCSHPRGEKKGKFQSWTPLTGDETSWNNKIDIFFAESQDPDSDDETKNSIQ